MNDTSQSFPPIIGDKPTVLILGTLPSKVSLKKQQYYGHPQNKFWTIIYSLFAEDIQEDYNTRIAFAKSKNLAIWDVCFTAIRPGSLDADINEETPNSIEEMLLDYPSIKTIAFNGKKAEQLFFKYFDRNDSLKYCVLLSSSPANAAYSFEEKLENWKQIIQ